MEQRIDALEKEVAGLRPATTQPSTEAIVKIKSALVTQMSGSVGGMTGASNRGGLYLRARGVPSNPNSSAQQDVRSRLSVVSKLWSGITDEQRAAWGAYAASIAWTDSLGSSITLTGQQAFNRVNTLVLQAGFLTTLSEAPLVGASISLGNESVAVDGANFEVSGTSPGTWHTAAGRLLVFAAAPVSPGTSAFHGAYRFAGSIAGTATLPQTIANPWGDASGDVKTAVRVVGVTNTGLITAVKRIFPAPSA